MKKQHKTWTAQQVTALKVDKADLTIAYLQWQDGQLDPYLPLVYCHCRQEHHESFVD
jgi:hypothetical protein